MVYTTVVGIDGDDGILAETCRILLIHNRTTREDMTYRVAGDGWIEMLPMNQVLAYSMTPVHVAPLASVWVILEIEMILTILIHHSVRVVHPTIKRSEVIRWAIVIGVGGVECIAELEQVECQSILLQTKNLDCSSLTLAQSERHIVIRTILSQTNVHPGIILRTCIEQNLSLILLFLDREKKILGRILHLDDSSITLVFDVHLLCKGRSCS